MLATFRRLAPGTGPIRRPFSANAFTVYAIHPVFSVGLALMLRDVTAPAIAKFGALFLLAVSACWLLAGPCARAAGVGRVRQLSQRLAGGRSLRPRNRRVTVQRCRRPRFL